jgi:hypothetical protein
MAMSVMERKHLMPHGAVREIAQKVGASEAYVSEVLNDRVRPPEGDDPPLRRAIRVAIARKLKMKVDDVFPPEAEPVIPAMSA